MYMLHSLLLSINFGHDVRDVFSSFDPHFVMYMMMIHCLFFSLSLFFRLSRRIKLCVFVVVVVWFCLFVFCCCFFRFLFLFFLFLPDCYCST